MLMDQPIVAKLAALSGEYLFFIGAAWVALLFLHRRQRLAAVASFAAAVLWLSYHLPVSLYLESLSADSFAETRNFDFEEARFWFTTLDEAINADLSLKKLAAYTVLAAASFYALRLVLLHKAGLPGRSLVLGKLVLAVLFIGVALHRTASTAVASYLDNTQLFEVTTRNFDTAPPAAQSRDERTALVVYIGESTSSMNMGLYGYPRDTTPALSRMAASDPKLLVFHNVFATHAHTSRSLLEALSFGFDARQNDLPIAHRKRVSIVDVLRRAGVQTRLASNQGLGGSWDHASSIIFRNSGNTFRVKAGPGGGPSELRFDDEFFAEQLVRGQACRQRGADFLHAYASHGPYLENIPARFRQPVDSTFTDLPAQALVDDPNVRIDTIDAYDSAIRYVDHSLERAIAHVRSAAQPCIFVYFADHGDAVYAGRGHDSARFKHEMARVPMLLYFNDAARAHLPQLYGKYRALAQARRIATLAQLPSTLMELAGVHVPGVVGTPVIGEATALPPILIRDVQGGGMSYLNLNPDPLPAVSPLGHRMIDRTDEETRRFVAIHAGRQSREAACSGKAESFEARVRSIMVAGCPSASPSVAGRAP